MMPCWPEICKEGYVCDVHKKEVSVSNFRWIVRDGKEELMESYCDESRNNAHSSLGDCHLRPIERIVIPQKKSLAQVVYEAWGGTFWSVLNGQGKQPYEHQANAVMDYLEKEGWRRPNE